MPPKAPRLNKKDQSQLLFAVVIAVALSGWAKDKPSRTDPDIDIELSRDGAAPAVRFSIAHIPSTFTGLMECKGFLYVSRDKIWYEVLGPEESKSHSFSYPRSQAIEISDHALGIGVRRIELDMQNGYKFSFMHVSRELMNDYHKKTARGGGARKPTSVELAFNDFDAAVRLAKSYDEGRTEPEPTVAAAEPVLDSTRADPIGSAIKGAPVVPQRSTAPPETSQPVVDAKMSASEARQQIENSMEHLSNWSGAIIYGNAQATDRELRYTVSWTKKLGGAIGPKVAGPKEGERTYAFKNMSYVTPPEHHWGSGWSLKLDDKNWLVWKNQIDAEHFVSAVNRMIELNANDINASPGITAHISGGSQSNDQFSETASHTRGLSVRQARKQLAASLNSMYRGATINENCGNEFVTHDQEPITDIMIDRDHFQFVDRGHEGGGGLFGTAAGNAYEKIRSLRFSTLPYVSAKHCGWGGSQFGAHDGAHWIGQGISTWSSSEEAQRFADALNKLIRAARGVGDTVSAWDLEQFHVKANEWRAMPVKPDLPEEARRHRVLAEHAIGEKDVDKAIEEYDAALDISPTWPDGQYNVAALCAEVEDYEEAIEHMQYYLELVPDGPDAQEAKDKVTIWRDKLTHR